MDLKSLNTQINSHHLLLVENAPHIKCTEFIQVHDCGSYRTHAEESNKLHLISSVLAKH